MNPLLRKRSILIIIVLTATVVAGVRLLRPNRLVAQWSTDSEVNAIAFSPHGTLLASAHYDQSIRIWDVAQGHMVHVLQGHRASVESIAWSPDGQLLVSGSRDKTVRLWEVMTGEQVKVVTEHNASVYSVAFHFDGMTVASGDQDGQIRISSTSVSTSQATFSHTDRVNSLVFSPDGEILASASFDSTVKLQRVRESRLLTSLNAHLNRVEDVQFSPDGQLLLTAGDDTIKLWRVQTRQLVRTLSGHQAAVLRVGFSPDGQFIASASGVPSNWLENFRGDRTIRIWQGQTGRQVMQLDAHKNLILGLAFSPDGQFLASGSWDKTIKIWRVR